MTDGDAAGQALEKKKAEYTKLKDRLSIAGLLLPLPLVLLLLFTGASGLVADFAQKVCSNYYGALVIYSLSIGLIFYIAGLPLSFYSGYVIEHRFGLSLQKLFMWASDELKGAVISVVIFLPMVELMYFALKNYPRTWWLMAGAAWVCVSVMLAKLAPVVIMPLFYKYKPMDDGELKAKIISLCEKMNTKVSGVYQFDMSRKTKKANAGLTGIGSTRRIILGDTLLSEYGHDEIEVILAHEIAHQRLLHIWKHLSFGAVSTIFGLYIAHLLLQNSTGYFGFDGVWDIKAFPLIVLGLSLYGLVSLPLQNSYSRHMESEADKLALETTKKPGAFISAMKKLSVQNLRQADPGGLVEFFLYSHPAISKRIKMAEEFKSKS